ncbi:hypothetical protein [Streptomyces sp. NPDC058572]|uniref:hypothetical protein n=1 Tax=Streptomyces sp. NPDC058572 TaxID=3346546 RepID=UPI00365B112B
MLRGEDLRQEAAGLGPQMSGDIPYALRPWEAEYRNPCESAEGHSRHGAAGGLTGIPTHLVPARVRLPAPGAVTLTWTSPQPVLPWASDTYCYAEVAGPVRSGAASALARHLSGRPRHERLTQAIPVTFASAYPALVNVLGGQGAYTHESAAAGRIAVWRLLRSMARLSGTSPADAVSEYVAGLNCLTWEEPSDDIWFLHVAVEHPATGTAWLVDGQDID